MMHFTILLHDNPLVLVNYCHIMHYTHIPRPSFPLATQVNSIHGRRYETINGKSYPSITSILSHTQDKSNII